MPLLTREPDVELAGLHPTVIANIVANHGQKVKAPLADERRVVRGVPPMVLLYDVSSGSCLGAALANDEHLDRAVQISDTWCPDEAALEAVRVDADGIVVVQPLRPVEAVDEPEPELPPLDDAAGRPLSFDEATAIRTAHTRRVPNYVLNRAKMPGYEPEFPLPTLTHAYRIDGVHAGTPATPAFEHGDRTVQLRDDELPSVTELQERFHVHQTGRISEARQ